MAEEEREEQRDEKESQEGKKSVLKWIIVTVVIILLGVVGGIAGWQYYKISLSGVDVKGKEAVHEPGIWVMDPIVVNLMDENGERYLKTTIQIEVSSQECVTELDRLKPKVTDNVLVLLSSKRYHEIAGFEGKQNLRDEIAVRLNRYLSKGQVRRIYFTEFLIQ